VRGPVECAEKCARTDLRIGRAKGAGPDPFLDERADPALIPIALRDNASTQPSRQGVHLEMGCGPLDLVDETSDVGFGQGAESSDERAVRAVRGRQPGQQALQRAVLTEVEQLVFPAKVVIQVAGRQIRSHRNLAHAGCREASFAEQPGRRPENLDAPRISTA
jgi:hypothetical protein